MLALGFPAAELLIGIGWLIPATRRVAGCVSMLMHLGLIGILGPWGLGHSAGVLVWNGALIGQAWFLAVARSPADRGRPGGTGSDPGVSDAGWDNPSGSEVSGSESDESQVGRWIPIRTRWGRRFARGVVILAIGMPLFERPGHWDHWLSWSLYSPHTSRVEIQVSGASEDRLPRAAREALAADRDGDGWRTLSLGDWSLSARGVPIYPQARYQLGLAVVLAREAGLEGEIRGIWKGAADRWTGRRVETPMLGRGELEGALRSFPFRPVTVEGFPRPPRR